jgi:hypothetical protein
MKIKDMRRSLFFWFRMMAAIIYPEWSFLWMESKEAFSRSFFISLYPKWRDYPIGWNEDDDEIPF